MADHPRAGAGRRPPSRDPRRPKVPSQLPPAPSGAALEPEADHTRVQFGPESRPAPELTGCTFNACRFENSSWIAGQWRSVTAADCVWIGGDLANTRADRCGLTRCRLEGVRLTGFRWTEGNLSDVTFDGCKLHLAGFRFSTTTRTDFVDCNLTEVNFQGADLRGARFVGCDLTGAEFSSARMDGTEFHNCQLVDIHGPLSFRGAVIDSDDLIAFSLSLAGAVGIGVRFKDV